MQGELDGWRRAVQDDLPHYARDVECPLVFGVGEGRDEASAGGVDVDGDVEAGALLEVVDCGWAMR